MSDPEELVISQSRNSALLGVLIFAGLFGGGGLLAMQDSPLMGWLALGIAAAGVLGLTPGLLRPRRLVEIGPHGFKQCGVGWVFVPWSEITDITVRDRQSPSEKARLKSVCVNVQDRGRLVHGSSRSITQAIQNRWFSPIFKLVFGAFLFAAQGWGSTEELATLAKSDLTQHATVEIVTGPNWPISANDLATLLRQSQQRYSSETAIHKQDETEPPKHD